MSKRIALLSGSTGQDGSYLIELLLSKGYEVHGIKRRSSSFNTERLDHLSNNPNLKLHYGDLLDSSSLRLILEEVNPDEVYNLGAMSHVRVSFDVPVFTADVTYLGCLRFLEAIRDYEKYSNKRIKYYQAGSSEMYGKVIETPQNELTPFYPRSPYAVAKVAAHFQTVNYREAYGMYCCNGILFNHFSLRRPPTFVSRKITQAAARIKMGLESKLLLGNLESKRDFGWAPDYVYGMWLMMQQDKPDDYVLATGETHSITELLDEAFELMDLDWKEYVEIDQRLMRPSEVDLLLGDASKAHKVLGWAPTISFKDSIKTMVEHDFKLAQQDKVLKGFNKINGEK